MKKFIFVEHHPNDSRIRVIEDGICQTLSGRMETGGGNVPLVFILDDEDEKERDNSGERE